MQFVTTATKCLSTIVARFTNNQAMTDTDTKTMAQSTPYPDELLTDEAHGDDAKEDWIERRDSHDGIIHQREEDEQWYRIEDTNAGPGDEAWIESKGLVSGEELKS